MTDSLENSDEEVEPIFRAEAIQVGHQLSKVAAALVGFDQGLQTAITLERT